MVPIHPLHCLPLDYIDWSRIRHRITTPKDLICRQLYRLFISAQDARFSICYSLAVWHSVVSLLLLLLYLLLSSRRDTFIICSTCSPARSFVSRLSTPLLSLSPLKPLVSWVDTLVSRVQCLFFSFNTASVCAPFTSVSHCCTVNIERINHCWSRDAAIIGRDGGSEIKVDQDLHKPVCEWRGEERRGEEETLMAI